MIEDLDELMRREGVDAILAEGNAFEVPDVYWLTGFRSPDPIICYHAAGEETVVATAFNTLERIKRESFVKRTYDLTGIYTELMQQGKTASDNPDRTYGSLLKSLFTGRVIGVPDHLPASVVIALQRMGYEIRVVPRLFREARARKSPRELAAIEKAGECTVAAVQRVIEMVKDSEIGPNGTLLYRGETLRVGHLKMALEHFLLDRGAESVEDAIMAVGERGFDWHYLGMYEDPLKAEVPIIVDVFPRLKMERYVADVTRTIVKGSVSKELRRLFEVVVEAREAALDVLVDDIVIDEVNLACSNVLKKHGFESRRLDPAAQEGMTHGLGHGIGLQIHESPNMYDRSARFSSGHVVAIEPGLYLRSIGGVRIENDYEVTSRKPRCLTRGLDDFQFV